MPAIFPLSRDRLQVIGLWLYATAWNIAKPYHIDDTAHLEIARWIAGHPWHPMLGSLDWADAAGPIHELNQPHLYFYLMAAIGRIFGWGELAQHGLQAAFALLAIACVHSIARRCVPDALLAVTAPLVVGPAFLLNQNVMVEIPLLAFTAGFFWSLMVPSHWPPHRRYLLAGGFGAAAVLTKYSAVILFPALLLAVVMDGQARLLGLTLVMPVALALWSGFNWLDYGGIHIFGRPLASGSTTEHMIRWMTGGGAWLLCLGAMMPLAPLRPWLAAIPAALIGLAAAIFLAFTSAEPIVYEMLRITFLAAALAWLAALGMAVWAAMTGRGGAGIGTRNLVLLVYWAAAPAAFVVLFAPFMATRHLLLSLPPILMLGVIALPQARRISYRSAALAVAAVLGAVLTAGDHIAAQANRQAASAIAARGEAAAIWFRGHHGWQWYASQAGFRQYEPAAGEARAGDLLVWPQSAGEPVLAKEDIVAPAGTWVLPRPCCLAYTARSRSGDPYRSSVWVLPWTLTRDPLLSLTIMRFERAAR